MLKFFRNIFKNKLGLVLTFVLLGVIALAFAVGDVAGNRSGGLSAGSDIAAVGNEKLTQRDLTAGVNQGLNLVRRENPTVSMQSFVAQGGLQQVLDQLIDRKAISVFAEKFGLRAGNNLVNSEIRQIPAFRGTDGNFDETVYKQALAQQNLTDAMVRDDFRSGLLAQQLIQSSDTGLTIPKSVADRYARLFKERRIGDIGVVPASLFAPKSDPQDAVLTAFYNANKNLFIKPERRTIRYAMIDDSAVAGKVAPSDAEIRARYERDKAKYAASEKRTILQLIVPTEQAAESIRKKVAGGTSLEAAARSAGLQTSSLGPIDKTALTSQSSSDVANAYFSAAKGTLSQPVKSAIGWHIGRVENVIKQPATTLAQATPEIRKDLSEEKRLKALSDLAASVDDELSQGSPLTEVAKQLGLKVQTTRPATADGRVYGENASIPEALNPVLATVFQMEESSPQIADIGGGQKYVIYEASKITPSAAAPLKEIRPDAIKAWKLAEGDKAAKAAAERILAEVAKGKSLEEAIRAEKIALPPAQRVNMTRQELAQQQSRRIPPPLALLFSMAQGTTKRLEIGQNQGYYLVGLDKIELGELAKDDPLIEQARTQLSDTYQQEIGKQFITAVRGEVGVKTNPNAVEAVRKQLVGER